MSCCNPNILIVSVEQLKYLNDSLRNSLSDNALAASRSFITVIVKSGMFLLPAWRNSSSVSEHMYLQDKHQSHCYDSKHIYYIMILSMIIGDKVRHIQYKPRIDRVYIYIA